MILTGYLVIVLLLGTSTIIGLPTPEAEPDPIPEDTTRLGDALYASTHRALYREGGPNFQDMTQTVTEDCFLLATLCSIALSDGGAEWLMTAMEGVSGKGVTDGKIEAGQYVDKAKFHMFEIEKEPVLEQHNGVSMFTYKQSQEDSWPEVSYKDDVSGHFNGNTGMAFSPNMQSVWWVGGWQAAFARVYGGGYLHGGVAAHALASIANRETVVQSGLSQDEYFEIARRAPKSPVMFGTKDNGAILDTASKPVGNHVYAVMWATMVDGKQKVKMRNPWAQVREWDMSKLSDDIDCVYHFANWDEFTWKG